MKVTITESIIIKKVIDLPDGTHTDNIEEAANRYLEANDEWMEWGNGWEPVHSDGMEVEKQC